MNQDYYERGILSWIPVEYRLEADFWFEYRRTIERLKAVTERIFTQLKTDGVITDFTEAKPTRYDFGKKMFRLFYECICPELDHTVTFRMMFFLERLGARIEEKSTSRQAHLYIASSPYEDEIARYVTSRLEDWTKGMQHEKLFNEFLSGMAKKYAHYGVQAFHASEQKDKNHGIDFTVRYYNPSVLRHLEVSFNLKSSWAYVRVHQKHYPQISTFVFTKNHLKHPKKLESRLIRFILRASHEVTHG